MLGIPTVNNRMGANRMKNNSSRKAVINTIDVLLPNLIFSFVNKNTATAVPPMTEGVIAEANSQMVMI